MIFFKFSLKQGKVLLGLMVHCSVMEMTNYLGLLNGNFGIVNFERVREDACFSVSGNWHYVSV